MGFFLTGATGAVGSQVAEYFSSNTEVFALIRGGKKRFNDGKAFGIDPGNIIDGNITESFFAIDSDAFVSLKERGIKKFIHSAASVKFNEEKKYEIWNTNFNGTRHAIALAKAIGAKEFHYISTVFADNNSNPYERSKKAAEALVRESGLDYNIYRLSIVAGHSKTGFTPAYNGYYGFLTGLYFLKKSIQEKTNEKRVSLPVAIHCSKGATINIITLDWMQAMLCQAICRKPVNSTMNIANPNPPSSQWLMHASYDLLGIDDIAVSDNGNGRGKFAPKGLTWLQKAVDRGLKIFRPYVGGTQNFSIDALEDFLGSRFRAHPDINYSMVKKWLQFAVENNFGK